MLNIAICDDLQSDRIEMEKLTKAFCSEENYDINIVHFESGLKLLHYYAHKTAAFDIVFLDIYMTGLNGLKSAEQIRKYDSDCKIIFTTASTEHSLESFKVFPFNYLVKPITKNTFNLVVKEAVKIISKEKQKSLPIKGGSTIQTIFYKNILFIESNARILTVYTSDSKIISYKSKLDEIQVQIDDKRFLRCHQSFLVNMDHVSSVEDYSFKLCGGKQIPITQRSFASIKRAFYDYILDKASLK